MKIKQSIVIGIIVVIVSVFACATCEKDNVQGDNKVDISYWQQKSPKLINMAGYSKLGESNSGNDNVSSNESKDMYIGKVTNPYGIRDDVLEFNYRELI